MSRVQLCMRVLLALATLGTLLASETDPLALIQRAVRLEEESLNHSDGYEYVERIVSKRFDGDWKLKSTTSKAHLVAWIEGSPFRSLIEREGKPLPPDEQREQEAGLREVFKQRREESLSDRAKRLVEYEKAQKKYLEAIREIPDAFDFRLVGEESVEGRAAWIIEATPRPGYQHKSRYSKLFTQTKGQIWVDKEASRWVRIDAELLDTVSFGWILVRVGEGARVQLRQKLVDSGRWARTRLHYIVSLRLGLIKTNRVEEETVYQDYRAARTEAEFASSVPGL